MPLQLEWYSTRAYPRVSSKRRLEIVAGLGRLYAASMLSESSLRKNIKKGSGNVSIAPAPSAKKSTSTTPVNVVFDGFPLRNTDNATRSNYLNAAALREETDALVSQYDALLENLGKQHAHLRCLADVGGDAPWAHMAEGLRARGVVIGTLLEEENAKLTQAGQTQQSAAELQGSVEGSAGKDSGSVEGIATGRSGELSDEWHRLRDSQEKTLRIMEDYHAPLRELWEELEKRELFTREGQRQEHHDGGVRRTREIRAPHTSDGDSSTFLTCRLVGSTSPARDELSSPHDSSSRMWPRLTTRADTCNMVRMSRDLEDACDTMHAASRGRHGTQRQLDTKDIREPTMDKVVGNSESPSRDARLGPMQERTGATQETQWARERELSEDDPIVNVPTTTQLASHLRAESASLSRFTWVDDRGKSRAGEGETKRKCEQVSDNGAKGTAKTAVGGNLVTRETTARQPVHRHAVSSRSVPHTPQSHARSRFMITNPPCLRRTQHSHPPRQRTPSSPSRTVSRKVPLVIKEIPYAISPLFHVVPSHHHGLSRTSTAQPQYSIAPPKPWTPPALVAGSVPPRSALLAPRSMRPLSLLDAGLPRHGRHRCLHSHSLPPLGRLSRRSRSNSPSEGSTKRINGHLRCRLAWSPMATQGRYRTSPMEDAPRECNHSARPWTSHSPDPGTGRLSWPQARRSLKYNAHQRCSQSQPLRASYSPQRWTGSYAAAPPHRGVADAHVDDAQAASRISYSPHRMTISYVGDSLTASRNEFVANSSSLTPHRHAAQHTYVTGPRDSKAERSDGGALSRSYPSHYLHSLNRLTNISARLHDQIVLPNNNAHPPDRLTACSAAPRDRPCVDTLSRSYPTRNFQSPLPTGFRHMVSYAASPQPPLSSTFTYARETASYVAAQQPPVSSTSTDTRHTASSGVSQQPLHGSPPTDSRQTANYIAPQQPLASSPFADILQTASYGTAQQPPPSRLPIYTQQTASYVATQQPPPWSLPICTRQTANYVTAQQPPPWGSPVYNRQTASYVTIHQPPPTSFLTYTASSSHVAVQTDSTNDQTTIELTLADLPLRRETPRSVVAACHDDSYHHTLELSAESSAPLPGPRIPDIGSPAEKTREGAAPHTLVSNNPTSSSRQPCNSTDDKADHDDSTWHNKNAGARAISASIAPRSGHHPRVSLCDGHTTTMAYSSTTSSDSICWTPLPANRFLYDAPPDAVYRVHFTRPQKTNSSSGAPKEAADSAVPRAPTEEKEDTRAHVSISARAAVGSERHHAVPQETMSATRAALQIDDGAGAQGKNPRLWGSREVSAHTTTVIGQPGDTQLPFPVLTRKCTKDSVAARWEQWLGEKERIKDWLIGVQKEREDVMSLSPT
eukprot:GEMP01002828.1.p1 GENE.GEMP01002828.1~~GEMP01002828.1.p1  ORF type:complete len:1365 (+),score=308.37 GEMP01002828.1:316-4410(+)